MNIWDILILLLIGSAIAAALHAGKKQRQKAENLI